MSHISERNIALRKVRRQQELATFKRNIRNLIYYHQSELTVAGQCSLCLDDRWLYLENIHDVVRLIITVFQEPHICSAHIEAFISKTLQCLQADPSIYRKLLSGGRQCKELVYRKITLLMEILDNQLLLENEGIENEIALSFRERSDFLVKLMDCAYSYNDWNVEDDYDENWDVEVKGICYTSVLNLFGKNPLLFHNYLDEYPISVLLEKSKGKRRVELLSLLKSIATYSQEKSEFQAIVYSLYLGFKAHLIDIRQLQHTLEVFTGELQLFCTFAYGWKFMDLECIISAISLINNNLIFKEYTCKEIFLILQFIRQNYGHIMDEGTLNEIDRLLQDMAETADLKQNSMFLSISSTEMETQQ